MDSDRTEIVVGPDMQSALGVDITLGAEIRAAYFFQKSADGLETGARGEDSLSWESSPSGEIVSFALCDGVAGSYLGYIAAAYLARELPRLFNRWPRDFPGEIFTADMLREELDSWKESAQAWLDQQPVSTNISPVLADVLNNRRRNGSHTVFFGGCIDTRQGRDSFFAWMGNVYGQVFAHDGTKLLDQATMCDDRVRWTTAHGCLGTPSTAWIPTENINRVLVATDGFDAHLDALLAVSSQDDERQYLEALRGQSSLDDATVLSLWLPETGVAPVSEEAAVLGASEPEVLTTSQEPADDTVAESDGISQVDGEQHIDSAEEITTVTTPQPQAGIPLPAREPRRGVSLWVLGAVALGFLAMGVIVTLIVLLLMR